MARKKPALPTNLPAPITDAEIQDHLEKSARERITDEAVQYAPMALRTLVDACEQPEAPSAADRKWVKGMLEGYGIELAEIAVQEIAQAICDRFKRAPITARISAANGILDRAVGKPAPTAEAPVDPGGIIVNILNFSGGKPEQRYLSPSFGAAEIAAEVRAELQGVADAGAGE